MADQSDCEFNGQPGVDHMGFEFLGGKNWAEVTRDERFFCQRLYQLILDQGPEKFIRYINEYCGLSLPLADDWEPGFEVCFYRDLWQHRKKSGSLFSPKRTFDLCLFSNEAILIIEAKAQQSFDAEQLDSFALDRAQVSKETGIEAVYVLGLASSQCEGLDEALAIFNGSRVLTWKDLAALYSDDAILIRADSVYEKRDGYSWGKNNSNGYMTGLELIAASQKDESFFIGRADGLHGVNLLQDFSSGRWQTQRYETDSVSKSPRNRNWFSLSDFVKVLSGMVKE